jgi:putative sigma-54 modulation protein
MKINLKGTGIDLTTAITDYATKKISSVEKYINKKNEDAVFMIELARTTRHHKHGEIFKAEVRVNGAGLNLFAEAESEDLYSAIDKVENELIHELVHTKGRQNKLLRRGQRAVKEMMKGIRGRFGQGS